MLLIKGRRRPLSLDVWPILAHNITSPQCFEVPIPGVMGMLGAQGGQVPEWRLKSGERVVSNMIAKRYWDDMAAALAEENGTDCRVITVDIDLKEDVLSWVVPTSLDEKIFYAAVHNTPSQLSRFVKGREPQLAPGNLMVVLKWRKREGGYFLVKTAGKHGYVPPEPWEEDCQKEDREWWANHAYIYEQKNAELQSSYVWRHKLMHCYICGQRKSRTSASVIGDMQICRKCSSDVATQGYVELQKVHGWGTLRVPGLHVR
jgi:hypothetical protein